MSTQSNAVRLLSQWHEIPLPAAQALWDDVVAAWKQAMAEFGVPEHPGGKCPGNGCPCSPFEALVTARAYELLDLPPD